MIDKINIGDMVYNDNTGNIGYVAEIHKGNEVNKASYRIEWNKDAIGRLIFWTGEATLMYKDAYRQLRAAVLSHSATR